MNELEHKCCPFCGEFPDPELVCSTVGADCWVRIVHEETCLIKDVTHVWGRDAEHASKRWNTRLVSLCQSDI